MVLWPHSWSSQTVSAQDLLEDGGTYKAKCDVLHAWAEYKHAFDEGSAMAVSELVKQGGLFDKIVQLRAAIPMNDMKEWVQEELDWAKVEQNMAKLQTDIKDFLAKDLATRTAQLHPLRLGASNSKSWKADLAADPSWEDVVAASMPLRRSAELFQAYTGLLKAWL